MFLYSFHIKNQIANRFIKNKEEKRIINTIIEEQKPIEVISPQINQEKRQIMKRQSKPLHIQPQNIEERKMENHSFTLESNPNAKVATTPNPNHMKQQKPFIHRMTSIIKRQTTQLQEPTNKIEIIGEMTKPPEIKLDIPVTNTTTGDIKILKAIIDRTKANPMNVEIENRVEINTAEQIQILESKIGGRRANPMSVEKPETQKVNENQNICILESNQKRKGKDMNIIKWEPPIVKETRPIFNTIQQNKTKHQLNMIKRLENSVTQLNITNQHEKIEMNKNQVKMTTINDTTNNNIEEQALNEKQVILIPSVKKSLQDEIGFRVLCYFLKKEPIIKLPKNKNSQIPQYFIEIIEPNKLTIPIIFDYLQQKGDNKIGIDQVTEKWTEYENTTNSKGIDLLLQSPERLTDFNKIFHTNLPFYNQDSICLILRGHIRNSFDKPDLYHLIKQIAIQYTELKIYIHTWNKKSSNVSWRSVPEDNMEITEDIIRNYFKDTAQYIRKIFIDDDTQIEIKGQKNGIICKTKQPIIAWKNMWYGIAKITEEVYNDKSTKNSIVVNTRFDVMQNSHTITATEIHLFIKEQLKAAKYQRNQFYYKNNNYFGIDNLYTGDIETVHKLVMHMYENLDTILAKYPKIFVQEVMVFYENNCILGELPKEEMYKNIQLYMKE